MSVPKRSSIQVLAPSSLTAAIKEAAARELTSNSEYVRRAVIERLRHDGVLPGRSATAEHQASAA